MRMTNGCCAQLGAATQSDIRIYVILRSVPLLADTDSLTSKPKTVAAYRPSRCTSAIFFSLPCSAALLRHLVLWRMQELSCPPSMAMTSASPPSSVHSQKTTTSQSRSVNPPSSVPTQRMTTSRSRSVNPPSLVHIQRTTMKARRPRRRSVNLPSSAHTQRMTMKSRRPRGRSVNPLNLALTQRTTTSRSRSVNLPSSVHTQRMTMNRTRRSRTRLQV
jgi:hypothetical protein